MEKNIFVSEISKIPISISISKQEIFKQLEQQLLQQIFEIFFIISINLNFPPIKSLLAAFSNRFSIYRRKRKRPLKTTATFEVLHKSGCPVPRTRRSVR